MINRPKELFAIFQKQSIESKEYDSLMKEREINQREIDRLERKENEIEMDYYDGKLSEEKKDALIKLTIEQRTAKEERNMDLDKKLDAIIKAEETKLALEKFQADFETNLENLTFEQKKMLVINASIALINIIGNLIFIPYFSFIGSAWVTLGSQALLMLITGYTVRKQIPIKKICISGISILFCAIL